MRAYQQGEARAFSLLYQRHAGRVYAFVKRRVKSSDEADEIFQATFLKIHRFRHRFDAKYPFAQWLYVITKSVLLDHLRKRGRSVPIEDGVEVSQIEVPPALKRETDLEVLQVLNAEQRKVVEMRIFEENSYEQIAARLGRNEAAVRQILSRALKKLKLGWRGGAP